MFPGRPEPIPSPNLWHWPEVYELENRAQDAGGVVWTALRDAGGWDGADVLDVGCGDGYHLSLFAATARTVTGVEPHPPLVRRARRRVAGRTGVRVLAGAAERLPLPDRCVDVVHARTAYFFGPGCEPGLAEADRVLRPGGLFAIVDLDTTRAPYGDWMRADLPRYNPAGVERFFTRHGFASRTVDTVWRFADRAGLDAVLRIEFSASVAARAITATAGLTVPVSYRLRTRRAPTGLLAPGVPSLS
ncbi:MAG: methyltransferase domain-containing protein [Pseudonocardiales bacterium]|nr:methyltransferase domain-containing protein [Pseudonocardiales bacterium]